jgi:hypothetical protein
MATIIVFGDRATLRVEGELDAVLQKLQRARGAWCELEGIRDVGRAFVNRDRIAYIYEQRGRARRSAPASRRRRRSVVP